MEEVLLQFCQNLQSIRYPVPGSEDDCFYIYEEIRSVVSEGLVTELISPFLPDHALETAVSSVMTNGIRLFCVLALMSQVNQVPVFLAHSTLDPRLPIREIAELHRIAPNLDIDLFTRFQRQFFPRVFQKDTGHLIFPNNTILPFISEKTIAEGSGGVISIVEIPSLLQKFGLDEDGHSVKVVRKKIKPARTPEETKKIFTDERECLGLYRMFRHPNIIPLLASFTVGDENNLLFPWYPTTLDRFLKKEEAFGQLDNTSTLLSAVVGLASALQAVHEPYWRSRKTPTFYARYGYHHDFRPENILVTHSNFILADFGLAYPRPSPDPPSSEWVENIGHYIAPECMDSAFEPQSIGRSYDIWAFGCFLSEIATYMAWGPGGIEEFRQERTTENFYEERYKNGYFFDGPSRSLKTPVASWLQRLTDESKDASVVSLVNISKRMLQYSPDQRLDMLSHSISLSFIHAKYLFRAALDPMTQRLSQLDQHQAGKVIHIREDLRLDASRLRAFGDYLGMENATKVDCELFNRTSFATLVKSCLEQISASQHLFRTAMVSFSHDEPNSELQAGLVKELYPQGFLDEPARRAIRELGEALPDQKYFWRLFRQRLFDDSRSEESLRVLEDYKEPDLYLEVGLHAKLQRLQRALQQKTSATDLEENLILSSSRVTNRHIFSRYHHAAIYNQGQSGSETSRKVLIEWVFQSQFPEDEPEDTRIDKLLRLARLLQCPKPPEFRTLDCLGFLSPTKDTAGYGFVYPFPADKGSMDASDPKPLRKLLDRDKYLVTLGDKFAIARAISNSLFQLHEHQWLHKNVRSENIIFFDDRTEKSTDGRAIYEQHSDPYIIGFHHGRPDDDVFYSDIPSHTVDPEAFLYQHPSYKPGETRFQKSYDYYGLGIILLELAFWRPALYLWKRYSKNGTSVGETPREIFMKYVPKLAGVMGNAYMEATKACLQEAIPTEQGLSARIDGSFDFYLEVVKRLDQCYVG